LFLPNQNLIELAFSAENYQGSDKSMLGLKWGNLARTKVNNYSFFFPFGASCIAVIIIYPLLFIWCYPRKYINDGKKRGLCYCFFKDLRVSGVSYEDDER
jgi:hypothetical protein